MASRIRFATLVGVMVFVTGALGLVAHRPSSALAAANTQADTIARITEAANAVLATLDGAARTKVLFPFDSPQKSRWSNLPSPMYQRNGLRMGDLTAAQRAAIMHMLSVALSADGYRKVNEIMRGDEVLRTNGDGRGGGGRGGGPAFGLDNYYLAFVGTPSADAPWMLQFGGHHLAINLTLAATDATMAPSLPAAQPASYSFEGRTVRPLGKENDTAFALVNSLDAEQQRQAILPYRVADLVLGAGRDSGTIQPEGIRASAFNASQQAMLWNLVREWVGIMNDTFAQPRMSELRSKLQETWFAWSGPTTNGSAAYFRVQGPTLVIEYAPQSSVDHIHTIYRDPTNDYGARIARQK